MAGNSALKRKRNHSDDEKLNHTASVQFNRELKKLKSFEMQKLVKTLTKDPNNSGMLAQVELLKSLDVAHLARRAMLSLGLDPPEKKGKTESSEALKVLEASMLKNKRLAPFMETWKAKANERAKKLFEAENAILKQSREAEKANGGGRRATTSTAESMFVGSLSGVGENSGFEDDIADFLGENKKKNRPGQRARKQKALMEEQRKTGKVAPGGLSSFREKKAPAGSERPPRPTTTQDRSGPRGRSDGGGVRPPRPGSTQDRKGPRSHDADGGGRPPRPGSFSQGDRPERKPMAAPRPSKPVRAKVEDKSHPSWAAKQAQKDKEKVDIHAFTGKKVVFDD
ncbi:Aste57867_12051 [Aphanomyces stellatus]|uniref:Aste57867_12051 protein n=1 Tax=Aphanomyces stellatus TaxID=120398 RepID=A0A485KWJ7_9STRA|nr:hypothetical protein As57867_012006 [Aphanomyces stellatus]VFT88906.1 Aste57867_12051 [Aphanomyces stellatus]